MKTYINPKLSEWLELTMRPTLITQDLSGLVEDVFEKVGLHGDKAIQSFTKKFDKVELGSFRVSELEFDTAEAAVSTTLKEAIALASSNIYKFHKLQLLTPIVVETTEGVKCWQESRAIERVGLYVPGGTAPLFSTVLMLGIPAKIAGCKQIVLCTPPNSEGRVADEILYAARQVGITQVYKIGGIQAVAALSLGTQTVPKVYKIFGPGNQYVTAAKQEAFRRGIAIDMPAGPSELLVVADQTCEPAFVASDLLSQAEHGEDSQVICLANSEFLLNQIIREVKLQVMRLPRKAIAKAALNNSKFIVLEQRDTQIAFINEYAPEHLILAIENEADYIPMINNAGSVFIGNYTPESAGDYASGTNHTLPTNGFAKSFSGVNLDAFIKKITFQKISTRGLQNIGPAIELMAAAELLEAHKTAVSLRLERLKQIENE